MSDVNEEFLRDQINQLIRDEIQENINEFVEMKEEERKAGLGFNAADDYTDLKVNIPSQEIDKIIKEYKKIKKYLSLCTGYRNSETLWDSWCNLVANKSCNSKHFDSGNDVSWFHLTSLVGE